ncbi:hypothetical protein BJI67_16245 (plasmid) [Acidihalobacter aeolianus]|uniref:Uncharacterized protein n=2 Tax=Acidihalobacter aeolianus TaxID=2792603 RepID=A0A1D8KCV8_9GAMM|nr:hypothetical protein BJI67_16245 [Acidihalobacter aeolianus]
MTKSGAFSIAALVIGSAALVLGLKANYDISNQHVKVVTVDMSRIINAERASVAQILSGGTPAVQPNGFPSQLKDTLAKVAGPNTIILVRQAVAIPHVAGIPDITAAVLKQLGLPATLAHLPTPMQKVNEQLGSTGFSYSQYFKEQSKKEEQTAISIMKAAQRARQGEQAP